MKKIVLLLLISFTCAMAHAETKWELKKDKEGIKVYTGSTPNSNIKAVKVTCILNANFSQLTALLLDTKAHEQWVYNTKTSYLVKQLSDSHLLYYSEIIMPWPLTNRDVVIEMTITQQPGTKVMYISANTAKNYVPVNKDKVRVPLSKVNWTVTCIGDNQLSIEYIGQADPGGSVPAWLVNSFSTKGPFETFKKLKELVASPAYRHAQYAFIQD
ncbi:MAG: START domain-containing protein [Sphingobacteriales bacterium]